MSFQSNTKIARITSETVQISPLHDFCKSWVFEHPNDVNAGKEEEIADLEANLADAVCRVAELNGLSINDAMHIFPFILRMLKSNSRWAK